ncbi:MAG: restriction endonuclease subunit S [Pseudomonas sp.]|jgi:type I restriction enzyme S subunit|nr:restriction endonuclease subunit S [Pseudomonas sp.]
MSSKTKTTGAMEDSNPALLPKLRFPEFHGQPVREIQLKEVTAESTVRNGKTLDIASVMGVTKAEGIVPMEDRLIASDIARYKLVRKDWFAYNPMRLNIGSIARWQGESDILVSPDYVVFKCVERGSLRIDPAYLDHFRRSGDWENFVSEKGDGSVRIRIYYNDLALLQLALPPYEEQQKIAECLSSLDELIAAKEQKLDTLKTHKKGLMQQLFPREGETQPNLRFSDFRESWIENKLEDICMSISSGRDKLDPEGAFDLYGSTSVIGKTTNPSFRGERILIARVGANAGLLTRAKGEFGVTDNTIVVSPQPTTNIDFIFHYLESININRLIFGSGQPLITGSILKNLPIFVPSELEQLKISACLSSLDDVIFNLDRELEAIYTHKTGLMQQLFPLPAEIDA